MTNEDGSLTSHVVGSDNTPMEFADALDLLSIQLDRLLATLPDRSLEARRQITRELHYEPRPEELQTILRIAEDEATGGPRFTIPRDLLRTRLVVERELRRLLEMKPLEVTEIEGCARVLPPLLDEVVRLENRLRTLSYDDEELNRGDKDYLLQMGDVLCCSRSDLIACMVLAIRLAQLTRAEGRGELERETEMLSHEQQLCIRSVIDPDAEDCASRATVDALAIQSLVELYLQEWVQLGHPSDDNKPVRAQRDVLIERLTQSQVALEFVASRVQDQQDGALQAGLSGFAEELRSSGRGLFSLKLRLAPVLRDPYEDLGAEEAGKIATDIDSMRALLRESVAGDVALPDAPKKVSEEELYLGALKDMRTRGDTVTEYVVAKQRPNQLARQRRRMKILGSVAGVLFVTSIFINFFVLGAGRSDPEPPSILELSAACNVTRVETAGPMMFAHVDDWADLSEEERQSRITDLGKRTHKNGFQSVILFNEFGEPAAAWQRGRGPGAVVSE